jgi:hypothetical protein
VNVHSSRFLKSTCGLGHCGLGGALTMRNKYLAMAERSAQLGVSPSGLRVALHTGHLALVGWDASHCEIEDLEKEWPQVVTMASSWRIASVRGG